MPVHSPQVMQFFSRSFAAAALALITSADAVAQGAMSGVPNAMQGFSQNRDQPIQIEAASLEMRDKKKEATFSGNVKVVQGDTTMTSKTLVVFYDCRSNVRDAAARRCEGIEIRADASCLSGARRQFVDPPAGSQGFRRGHAKGSGRDGGDRGLRPAGQPHHHGGRGDGVVLTQCKNVLQRRPPQGGHDHRRVACRIRQQGARYCIEQSGQGCGSGSGGSKPAPVAIPSLIPGKK